MDYKHTHSPRPRKTTAAVALLYVALFVSATRTTYMEPSILEQSAHPVVNAVLGVLFLGITLFLIVMIGKARTWARTTYLVWFIVSLPVFAVEIDELAANPVEDALGILSTIISLVALVLLFQKESRAWFRTMKANR